MPSTRLQTSLMTLATVWQRALADAFFAPRQFRRVMPEFRKVSDMLVHRGVGSLEIGQLPECNGPIQLLNLDPGYGGMPPQDLYALARLVRWLHPARIFEIGTFQGVTTAHMALNSEAEIFTLDLPRDLALDLHGYTAADAALLQPRENIGRAYRPFNDKDRIRQLFGDSRTFDYQPYYGTMDLVLVDACHLFDYVLSDSRHAFRLLKDTGIILWHDFGSSRDVVRALQIMAKERPILHIEGTWLALHARGIALSGKPEAEESSAHIQQVA
jgi:predicted O-methyltransferase YrrM